MPKPTGPQFEAYLHPSPAWGSDYAGMYSAQINLKPLGDANSPGWDVLDDSYVTWNGPGQTAHLVTKNGPRRQYTDLGEHKTATSAVKAVAKRFRSDPPKIKPSFAEEDVRPMADLIQKMGVDEFKATTKGISSMTGAKHA